MSQKAFAAALMNPDAPPPAGLADVRGDMPVATRFNVYRNNVFHSLIETLRAAFPLTEKVLGTTAFSRMAADFIRAHPPANPVLYRYGRHLPEFLENYEPHRSLGYLPDLARLETAILEVCHAPDHQHYPARKMTELTESEINALGLELAPCVRILSSAWPVHMLWEFLAEAGPPPEMKPQAVMVFRHNFSSLVRLLPAGGCEFLEAVRNGATLQAAMEASGGLPPEKLHGIFNDLMQFGLVKSVKMKGT